MKFRCLSSDSEFNFASLISESLCPVNKFLFSTRFSFHRIFGYQPDFCFRCSFGFPSGFCFHEALVISQISVFAAALVFHPVSVFTEAMVISQIFVFTEAFVFNTPRKPLLCFYSAFLPALRLSIAYLPDLGKRKLPCTLPAIPPDFSRRKLPCALPRHSVGFHLAFPPQTV